MPAGSHPLANCSRAVVVCFCLKFGIFAVVCGLQVALGGSNPFFLLAALASRVCVIPVVCAREVPLGRSLSHWDKAVMLGLVSQLG